MKDIKDIDQGCKYNLHWFKGRYAIIQVIGVYKILDTNGKVTTICSDVDKQGEFWTEFNKRNFADWEEVEKYV